MLEPTNPLSLPPASPLNHFENLHNHDLNKIYSQNNSNSQTSSGFLHDASEIPSNILAYLKDEEWMAFLSELFSVTAHIGYLTTTEASRFVPYVNILSSPIYLFYAIKNSCERFYLMILSIKVMRFGDAFFWGGKGIGSLGASLSDIIKPFTGGIAIFGISYIPGLTFTLAHIFPILLIICSGIGGSAQAWGILHRGYLLHRLKQKSALDGSMKGLESLLLGLYGPQLNKGAHAKIHDSLDRTKFSQMYFISKTQETEIKGRIEALFAFKMDYYCDEVSVHYNLLSKRHEEFGLNPINNDHSLFEQLDGALLLCENMLEFCQKRSEQKGISTIIHGLEACKLRLLDIKKNLHREGGDIADAVKNEMKLKIREETIFLFASLAGIAAGILFLTLSQNLAANSLALTSSSVASLNILLSKAFHHYNYPQLKEFLDFLQNDEKYRNSDKKCLEIPTEL